MSEKKSVAKFRGSPDDYAESFFASHRKNIAEVFGEKRKSEDKLFQHAFGAAYGKLSGKFSGLKADMGEVAPALVHMNDGRVPKGGATYHGGETMIFVSQEKSPLDAKTRRLNVRFFPGADNGNAAEKNEKTGAYRVMPERTRGEKSGNPRVMTTSEYEDADGRVSDIRKNADAGAFNHLAEYVNEASKSGDADAEGKRKQSKKRRHGHG